MSDARLRFASSVLTKTDSWTRRIRENAQQLLAPACIASPAAGGQAFHLMDSAPIRRAGGAQTASLLTHGIATGALLLLALHSPLAPTNCPDCVAKPSGPITYTAPKAFLPAKTGTGGNMSGGARNPIPATRGLLPPYSSVALAPPRIPENENVKAPVPQALFDPEAPALIAPVNQLGLPWMSRMTDSGGPGPGTGIGDGPGHRAGTGDDGGDGIGLPGAGHDRVASEPTCAYCPNPAYTDEARHEKIQGSVMLEVLVGADGRALDVRVAKGLGLGLDERAAHTIAGWRFHPARDRNGRAVRRWIAIETVFRLF